jgi:hypothetical protein
VLPPMRAHADLVDPIALDHFLRETGRGLEFDVMLEAKAKDLALMRVRDQLAARGSLDRPHRPASFLGQPRHPLRGQGQEAQLLSSPEQPEADSQEKVPPPSGT